MGIEDTCSRLNKEDSVDSVPFQTDLSSQCDNDNGQGITYKRTKQNNTSGRSAGLALMYFSPNSPDSNKTKSIERTPGSTNGISQVEELHSQESFRCLNPINGEMRDHCRRRETFFKSSAVWPNSLAQVTPTSLSKAGFYYLGKRDEVKCWYCNGKLRNFDIGDIPWQEHAKWFPMCEFLLQQRGIDFVRDVASTFPTLRRPTLHNPASSISPKDVLCPLPCHGRDVPPPRRHAQSSADSSNHVHV